MVGFTGRVDNGPREVGHCSRWWWIDCLGVVVVGGMVVDSDGDGQENDRRKGGCWRGR